MLMETIHRIVAPYDFSTPSKEGLKKAIEFAKHFGAELLIVHVIPPLNIMPPVGPPISPGFLNKEELVKEQHDMVEANLAQLQKEELPEDLKSRVIVVEGSPADEIAHISEDENADLIIIATHGWAGWRRFVFGSVTEKVIRFATCPVLTVPQPGKH
jgi:nucleotide-binding universal stress UspA family protein